MDANFLASALPDSSRASFTGASLCSFAFSCCCETRQEPGQLCDVLLNKSTLVTQKQVLLLSFPLPATTTVALLLLSNGTLQGFEPLGVRWSPAERYNREEWRREPFSSQRREAASLVL